MKGKSNALKEISNIAESHFIDMGLCKNIAKDEAHKLIKKIGSEFQGRRVYISMKMDLAKRIELIGKELKSSDVISATEISKNTGIPKTTVIRIINEHF